MPDLLLELLSEEIPARMQARAALDFRHLVLEQLTAAGLSHGEAQGYVTPRRLALAVPDLPARQPDTVEERKGPRVDAPEKALEGFMKANGLSDLDACERREMAKGTFYFLTIAREGVPTVQLLPGLVQTVVDQFPWPKSMRWANGRKTWVRPMRSGLCLFDGKPMPFLLDFGGVKVPMSNTTYGHRFMAPGMITVKSVGEYRAKLRKAKVILDRTERRAEIDAQLRELAMAEGLIVKDDQELLDEVTGLCEWPVPLIGGIDQEFMDLPPEVLTTAMRSHQKYFSMYGADGGLAPRFGMVANIEASEKGMAVIAGNERVLRARLADAKFFWDQDRATPLDDRLPMLDRVVFHAALGSMGDKIRRVEALASEIAAFVPACDPIAAAAAARLAKADLVTGMVGEFPELQGVMGRYYARAEGLESAQAAAIAEHYAPLGPHDSCPKAPLSVAVALADKIDTLVGFWAIDEKPTGSKDPFALRRAALGVIRLIVENELRLPLETIFGHAHGRLREQHGVEITVSKGPVLSDLTRFFAERLKVALREKGVRHDLIAAVFAVQKLDGGAEDDFTRLLARVKALDEFLLTEGGVSLLVAYRRAANILRIEEKKDNQAYREAPDPDRYDQDEERALGDALEDARVKVLMLLEDESFGFALRSLSQLRGTIDPFFDKVTVNADDPALRENRLKLLAGIAATLETVADFSQIEG